MELSRYSGDLSTVDFVDLLMIDLSGCLRSISLPRAYLSESRVERGVGVDPGSFGLAGAREDGPAPRLAAIPDFEAAFVEEKDGAKTLHALCDIKDERGADYPLAPRSVVRAAFAALVESGIADDARMLAELEFFVFDDVRYASTRGGSYFLVESREGIGAAHEGVPRFPRGGSALGQGPCDSYARLRERIVVALEAAGIAVKYHHHEGAASQLEIELDFASPLAAADSIAIAKWIVKCCASELGLHATFMPKPSASLAGSGLHIHQYLAKSGASLFPGSGACGLSPLALSYSAGILAHSVSGSLLAWACPSTNSYKRLGAGSGAPTEASLSLASRKGAMRVPGYLRQGEERVEYRAGDATANPHYFLSAMLLAGLDGARRGLDPEALGFMKEGGESLPTSLRAAIEGLKVDSDYLASAFPPELVRAWIEAKVRDAAFVEAAPTPQEYELYF
jgi:Glutamine synthetase